MAIATGKKLIRYKAESFHEAECDFVAYRFWRDMAINWTVQIDVARSAPVDAGTYATLAYQGITGVAFINLASEPGEHGPLVAMAGRPHAVLPTRDIGIAALLNAGPEVVGHLDALLADASLPYKMPGISLW